MHAELWSCCFEAQLPFQINRRLPLIIWILILDVANEAPPFLVPSLEMSSRELQQRFRWLRVKRLNILLSNISRRLVAYTKSK